MFKQRLRIFFKKEGFSRFLGHHDLMRLFERALRRAGVSLRYSAGYNPRPQLSFPTALGLGMESQSEVFEVELLRWTSPRLVAERLARQLPDGIAITGTESVHFDEKSRVIGARYCMKFCEAPVNLASKVEEFLASKEAMVDRQAKSGMKSVDVRAFVDSVEIYGDAIRVGVKMSPAGAAKPREVLQALFNCADKEIPPVRIVRTNLELAAPSH